MLNFFFYSKKSRIFTKFLYKIYLNVYLFIFLESLENKFVSEIAVNNMRFFYYLIFYNFYTYKFNKVITTNFCLYFYYKLRFKHFEKLVKNFFFYNMQNDLNNFFIETKFGVSNSYLNLKLSINDYFFNNYAVKKWNKNSRWYSMEEIITHFIFYSEGFALPAGFSFSGIEAPKGHLGVSIVSQNSNKPNRVRIKSSILNMMGQLTQLVEGVPLGDFVVIVSGSYVVVGEVDR